MKKLLLAIDIGNVCVSVDYSKFTTTLALPDIPDDLRDICREYEWGIIRDEEVFFNRLAGYFSGKHPVSELKKAFNAVLTSPVPGMVELVNEFADLGVKAAFFSDISPTHLRRTKELFPAFDIIGDGAFSFACGAWKPSDTMLEYFESRYGRPDLYVDDRLELVEGAKKRNWCAHQFVSAGDLRKKILSLC